MVGGLVAGSMLMAGSLYAKTGKFVELNINSRQAHLMAPDKRFYLANLNHMTEAFHYCQSNHEAGCKIVMQTCNGLFWMDKGGYTLCTQP
jgi:hypothetical protein